MQTTDLRLLKNLKNKITTSNLRSIYLNALASPFLTRLDLADLNNLQAGMSESFLEQLFTESNFSFDVNAASGDKDENKKKVLNRLSAITIENEDHFEEHGRKTFGFGYPVLLIRDPDDSKRIIKAPLIIWSLDIERDFSKDNQWKIRREENFSVITNPGLATYMRNTSGIELQTLYDQMLEDSILDKDELAEMAYIQMQQLNPNISERTEQLFRKTLDSGVLAISTEQEIASMSFDNSAILWSGIFGLFRSQKDSIFRDLEKFTARLSKLKPEIEKGKNPENPGKSSFMKHSFTMLQTDPCQQHLLHSLDKGNNLIVQGPPGTGKSQTLTGIVANTLSNAGTCLVVCEKKTALDVIYLKLKEMGLEELAIVVEDEYRDRYKVVNSVRERSQHQHKPYQVSATFIRLLKSCASHVERLQGFHNKLQKPISGEHRWTEVVGQFLAADKKKKKGILSGVLKSGQFEFSTTEYEEIISILAEGEGLFEKLGTLNHPLNAMHDRFFGEANAMQVEADTMKALNSVSYVVQSAQRDILTYLFEYEQLLDQHFSDVYLSKMQIADKIIDIIEAGLAESKYYFTKNTGIYRKIMKSFSSKYEKLETEKAEVLQSYYELQKVQKMYRYFDFQFMDCSDINKLDFNKLLGHINDYKIEVYDWYESRNTFIQKLVKDLGPGKIFQYVNFDKRVAEVSKNLDKFEENFASSKVFKVKFSFVTRNIRKRLTQIEDIDQNLKKLKEEFDNFGDYHALKFFSLSLNKQQNSAFLGLAQVKATDWEATFSSWYLNALLAHHEDEMLPDSEKYDLSRSNLRKESDSLDGMLIAHTLKYWRGKQTQEVRAFHKEKAPLNLHSLYNTRTNKSGQRTPLSKITEASAEVFTSFFPVLLVSPEVCSSILPLVPNLYDVVIFDEASQLNLEDSFCALVRGKYKIISGDSHQLPPPDSFQSHYNTKTENKPVIDDEYLTDMEAESINYLSESESLLEYSLSEGSYKETFLEVHYRSRHPFLIDFSNAAFYANRLTSFPAENDMLPIEFHEIGGIYDEYCNKDEAEAILNYLLDIELTEEKAPSIAIATFNLHQRNLILKQLQQRALKDPAAGQKFKEFKKAGLLIKNLENIQGEERDIVLISGTFGLYADGSWSENFGPLNHENGYKLLNVMITRARNKVCIFNSIPSKKYENYAVEIEKKGNTGKGILYAYLSYAKSVNEKNEDKRKEILKLLYEHCNKKPAETYNYQTEDVFFKNQVIQFLEKSLPDLRIKCDYQHAGFRLPIAIFDKKGNVILAFYYDVYHENASEEAWAWDIYHEQYLKKTGIMCHRIWSKEWWEDLHPAQQKLLVQIRDVTG